MIKGSGCFYLLRIKEALIKAVGIVSNARKSVTESVEKRFNQRFLNTPMFRYSAKTHHIR